MEVLGTGRFEELAQLVGEGPGRRELRHAQLSPEAQEERRPQPPEELVGALQTPVPGCTRTRWNP